MSFRIAGLSPEPFRRLRGLDDTALAAHRARRVVVDKALAYPERIGLRDAEPGETLLLVNYLHQPAETPFRASHAVYVAEEAESAAVFVDEVPAVLGRRLISLRAFDAGHGMVHADVGEGHLLAALIEDAFTRDDVAYLHAHFAKQGCFAAQIDRI